MFTHISWRFALATWVNHLLVNDLDLFVDHPTGKTIDCYMHPVTLFALDNEAIDQACSIRRELSGLRDHIDQQVPRPRLIHLTKCSRDGLALRLWNCWPQPCFIRNQIHQPGSVYNGCRDRG